MDNFNCDLGSNVTHGSSTGTQIDTNANCNFDMSGGTVTVGAHNQYHHNPSHHHSQHHDHHSHHTNQTDLNVGYQGHNWGANVGGSFGNSSNYITGGATYHWK